MNESLELVNLALERAKLKDINAKEQDKIWELQKQRTALEVEYTERKRWIDWDIMNLEKKRDSLKLNPN